MCTAFFNSPVNCEYFRITEKFFKIFFFVRSGVGLPLKRSHCMVCALCTCCRGKQQIFSHYSNKLQAICRKTHKATEGQGPSDTLSAGEAAISKNMAIL